MTKDEIFFTRQGDKEVLDLIYLWDVVGVEDMDGKGPADEDVVDDELDANEAVEIDGKFVDALQIRTATEGYNRYDFLVF